MAVASNSTKLQSLCYLVLIVSSTLIIEGDAVLAARPFSPPPTTTGTTTLQSPPEVVQLVEGEGGTTAAAARGSSGGRRRRLVGSRAPTCTYNECRGCGRRRCSARGVPVDASDPVNSAYHYICFCHI